MPPRAHRSVAVIGGIELGEVGHAQLAADANPFHDGFDDRQRHAIGGGCRDSGHYRGRQYIKVDAQVHMRGFVDPALQLGKTRIEVTLLHQHILDMAHAKLARALEQRRRVAEATDTEAHVVEAQAPLAAVGGDLVERRARTG
ncbi:hypothetical protein AWV80_04540 [Cupriavidus sp. UYMU48A]|nr:hypothetical protein AWV80_04540 [Cupriavidus sp. UYMU48A]